MTTLYRKTLLNRIIDAVLLRTDSVDDLLKVFNKTQVKLSSLTKRLEALAAQNEAQAQRALDEAKRQQEEAKRAATIASNLSKLTSAE